MTQRFYGASYNSEEKWGNEGERGEEAILDIVDEHHKTFNNINVAYL
jgi:hypothetical protein